MPWGRAQTYRQAKFEFARVGPRGLELSISGSQAWWALPLVPAIGIGARGAHACMHVRSLGDWLGAAMPMTLLRSWQRAHIVGRRKSPLI